MEVFTSKAAFPYGNFFSEFGGALVAGFFAHSVPPIRVGRFSLRPILTGFVTTLVSGFIFVTILKVVVGIPMPVYLYGILPAVAYGSFGNAGHYSFPLFPQDIFFRQ